MILDPPSEENALLPTPPSSDADLGNRHRVLREEEHHFHRTDSAI
jgi:hypothetical protein